MNNSKSIDLKIKQLQAEIKIEQNNKKFYKLTKAQQRVHIAKDVLLQLKSKKFIASKGCYISSNELENKINEHDSIELKSLLPTIASCEVCAKGSLFLSEVMNRNDFKVGRDEEDFNTIGISKISRRLNDIFTDNQLDLIETAFEKRVIVDDNNYLQGHFGDYTNVANKAIEFGEKYKTDNDRLVAILKNLISNKGAFKP
jgi:hypothetical protein